jgi:hypothetical protein
MLLDGPPLWLRETKTSSEDISYGSTFWKRTTLDNQIGLYILGARSLGYNVVGCLYDVLRVPMLKPYQVSRQRKVAETPEEFGKRCLDAICKEPGKYFVRGEVVRLEDEQAETAMDVWQTSLAMREAKRLKIYPRHSGSCMQWSRACEYLSVCCREASVDDTMLFERVETEHSELELSESGKTRITQSSIKTFRSCPRKYYLRNVLGIRSRKNVETLRRGKSVHAAIEALCKFGSMDVAMAALDTSDPFKLAKERAMLIGYVAMWNAPFGIVAVEKQFEIPLINPETGAASKTFSIAGKFDAICTMDRRHLEPQMLVQQLERSVGPGPDDNDAAEVE